MNVVCEREPERALAAKPYTNPPRHAVETIYQISTDIQAGRASKSTKIVTRLVSGVSPPLTLCVRVIDRLFSAS